jgi:hypothetical protein
MVQVSQTQIISTKRLEATLKVLEFELQQHNVSDYRYHALHGEIKALKDVIAGKYRINGGRA